MFDFLRPLSNLTSLLTSHPSESVRHLPTGSGAVRVDLPGNAQLVYVRDVATMRTLASDRALDRGPGVNLLRSVFGPDTLFLMPHGKSHQRRAGEFNKLLNQAHVEALTPRIAAHAGESVEAVREAVTREPARAVDMQDVILRYLFDVGALAITGEDVDLASEVAVFRRGVDALHREAASMIKTALAANAPATAGYMAKEARRAAGEFQEAGRRMLVAGAGRHDLADTLALRTLKRHQIDPAGVDDSTVFPTEALNEVTMNLAASLFTTGNLIERTLDHFQRHPQELRLLRDRIRADFPDGVASLTQLRNCPTLQMLVPAMLSHSPVGIVSRDVVAPTSFTDVDGTRHRLRPGDAVIFDVEGMQEGHRAEVAHELAQDGQPTLELLNQRHDDVMQTFFHGPNRCPGRFLAVADSLLFLIPMLATFDSRWVDHDRPLERGIVNRLAGSSLARLTPTGAGASTPGTSGRTSPAAPALNPP